MFRQGALSPELKPSPLMCGAKAWLGALLTLVTNHCREPPVGPVKNPA